jgi:hypothetical protein
MPIKILGSPLLKRGEMAGAPVRPGASEAAGVNESPASLLTDNPKGPIAKIRPSVFG